MREKLAAKLRGCGGETIAETLIALLISALALTMLAGSLTSIASMVQTSNRMMENYYSQDNALVNRAEASKLAEKITVTIEEEEFDCTGYVNSTFGSTPVIAYDYNRKTETPSGG